MTVTSRLKTIALLFLPLAASLVSPYFVSQFGFGAQFLASDWFKAGDNGTTQFSDMGDF